MRYATAPLLLCSLLLPLAAGCEDDVPSGTYSGTIERVVADEREIYVNTDDGRELELYFTDQTQLTRAGQPAEFPVLANGQKVRIEVVNEDGDLRPVRVEILE